MALTSYPLLEKLGRSKTMAPVRMVANRSTEKLDFEHSLLKSNFCYQSGNTVDGYLSQFEGVITDDLDKLAPLHPVPALESYLVGDCQRKQSMSRSRNDFLNGSGNKSRVENDRKLYGIACEKTNK